jgi:hypothetical protein
MGAAIVLPLLSHFLLLSLLQRASSHSTRYVSLQGLEPGWFFRSAVKMSTFTLPLQTFRTHAQGRKCQANAHEARVTEAKKQGWVAKRINSQGSSSLSSSRHSSNNSNISTSSQQINSSGNSNGNRNSTSSNNSSCKDIS